MCLEYRLETIKDRNITVTANKARFGKAKR